MFKQLVYILITACSYITHFQVSENIYLLYIFATQIAFYYTTNVKKYDTRSGKTIVIDINIPFPKVISLPESGQNVQSILSLSLLISFTIPKNSMVGCILE